MGALPIFKRALERILRRNGLWVWPIIVFRKEKHIEDVLLFNQAALWLFLLPESKQGLGTRTYVSTYNSCFSSLNIRKSISQKSRNILQKNYSFAHQFCRIFEILAKYMEQKIWIGKFSLSSLQYFSNSSEIVIDKDLPVKFSEWTPHCINPGFVVLSMIGTL